MKTLTVLAAVCSLYPVAVSAYGSASTSASTPVCSKSPYSDLSFLSAFQPALSICSQYYPLTAYTTTVTVNGYHKRNAPPRYGTTTAATTTSSCGYACQAWSSFAKSQSNIVSTLCSCIETTPTVTVTKTSYPTTPLATSTTISTTSSTTVSKTTPVATSSTTSTSTTSTSTTTDSTVITISSTDSYSTTSSTTTTSASSTSSPCVRLGCFTDSINDRTLGPGYHAGANSASLCQGYSNPAPYFGLEYNSECFWGNSINPDSQKVDDSNCNYTCEQDPNESDTCGGNGFIEIYQCTY